MIADFGGGGGAPIIATQASRDVEVLEEKSARCNSEAIRGRGRRKSGKRRWERGTNKFPFGGRLREGQAPMREEALVQLETFESEVVRGAIRLEGGGAEAAAEYFCAGDHSETAEEELPIQRRHVGVFLPS